MFNEINIELTNRCNKHCHICNRWRDNHTLGDMSLHLLSKIAPQLGRGTIVHLHNNGEPLLYGPLDYALQMLKNQIRHIDTNGILLCERAEDLFDMDIIAVSIIEGDPIGIEQLSILKKYLEIKPAHQQIIARCVGNIDSDRLCIIAKMNIPIVKRILHKKEGRHGYTKEVIKPEDCICRDFLNHPAIDFRGNFSMCVKYDPDGIGVLGNVHDESIAEIWYGEKRKQVLQKHMCGNRKDIAFCSKCDYYGLPNG